LEEEGTVVTAVKAVVVMKQYHSERSDVAIFIVDAAIFVPHTVE